MAEEIQILVIGPRRRNMGLGEFLCREFHRAGAKVAAIVASSLESGRHAQKVLCQKYGITCEAFASIEEAHRKVDLHAAVLAVPTAYHLSYLWRLWELGLSCLAEKPLFWLDSTLACRKELVALLERYGQKKLFLSMITPYVYTLSAYFQLYPKLKDQKVETFFCHFPTRLPGREGLLDMAPHPISLLYQLLGPGDFQNLKIHWRKQGLAFSIEGIYLTTLHAVPFQWDFFPRQEKTRPIGYAINGCFAQRVVDYSRNYFGFTNGEREITFSDPLSLVVQDFLHMLRKGASLDRQSIYYQMELLIQLMDRA